MLALLFSVANTRYALRCSDVHEVLPRGALRRVPGAPPAVAGLLLYRGEAIGVVDLCQMIASTPCKTAYSSRLVVVHWRSHDGSTRMLGVEVEDATETLQIDASQIVVNPLHLPDARYLGPLIRCGAGDEGTLADDPMVQLIEVDRLLSPEIAAVFASARSGAAEGPEVA